MVRPKFLIYVPYLFGEMPGFEPEMLRLRMLIAKYRYFIVYSIKVVIDLKFSTTVISEPYPT